MNIYPKEWDLNLEGDTFNALKNDFNMVLRKTLSNMESKGSELAELTVKLKIQLKKEKASGAGEQIPRDIIVPKFDHKVSSVMQIKAEVSGSLGGEYELVWDTERNEWIMREIVDPQQSLFDYGHEVVYTQGDVIDVDAAPVDAGPPALTGSRIAGLLSNLREEDEGCAKDFPDCLCLTCMNHGSDTENGACCTRHARDCRDTDICVDYINTYSPYEYEEPGQGGYTCEDCTYFPYRPGETECQHINGPGEVTANRPVCEELFFCKSDRKKEDSDDE